jgi:hypothetical protein
MKRLFAYAALAAALVCAAPMVGCAEFGGLLGGQQIATPKTPKQVFAEAVGGYKVARTIANKYEALPPCPQNAPVCKDTHIVAEIEVADAKAWDAITKAQAVVEADNPNADTVSRLLGDLSAAVAAFTAETQPLKVS